MLSVHADLGKIYLVSGMGVPERELASMAKSVVHATGVVEI